MRKGLGESLPLKGRMPDPIRLPTWIWDRIVEQVHVRSDFEIRRVLELLNNLIILYETWNKPEEAEEWRAKLTQIEDFEEWQDKQ